MKDTYKMPCNIAHTLNIVGDRWTLLIIHEILIGHTTFNEIKKGLEGISANLLSERLQYLEQSQLLTTTLYSAHPPRYEYKLTQSGLDLEPVFHSLIIWGRHHLETCYKKLIHTACGHEVTMQYYCPHCDQKVQELSVQALEVARKD